MWLFITNWRRMRNILETNLINLSMGLIVRWNLKMNLERIFLERKLSVRNQNILNVSCNKFIFKFVRCNILKNVQSNCLIIMHHISPMQKDWLLSFIFLKHTSFFLIHFFIASHLAKCLTLCQKWIWTSRNGWSVCVLLNSKSL